MGRWVVIVGFRHNVCSREFLVKKSVKAYEPVEFLL
jgi:hypothetical protein